MADRQTAQQTRRRPPAPAAKRGRTTIADKVVERVASIATSEIEAVIDTRRGWTKLVHRGLPRASAIVAGDTCRIQVEVAAIWPAPLAEVASRVRDHVTTQVAALTGVTVAAVDVSVADVVHVEAAQRRVQ